jgi:hypothetical protein
VPEAAVKAAEAVRKPLKLAELVAEAVPLVAAERRSSKRRLD